MKKEFEIKRREEYDVAVLGGGTAGVSAAIAAKDRESVLDIPIEKIRTSLAEIGAIFP